MSDVVAADVVEAASYYQDANGQIYKASAPLNLGDTIIPFPSESIDAYIGNFGVSGKPYMPAADVIEDRSAATATAENVKYHPALTDMKLTEMIHVQNEQLNAAAEETLMLENELEAANSKIADLEAEVSAMQKQIDDLTKPTTKV